MIIVFLLAAIVFYAVLYLTWEYSQSKIHTLDGWLNAINNMIFMPDSMIFMLLRTLIFIVLCYVVADSFRAGAKSIKRKKQDKKDKEEAMALRTKVYDETYE